MQISSRFTMAIHMFSCIDIFADQKMTSDFMAGSIGTNPVIIRKLLQQLKAAGLIEVSRGTGGVAITKPLDEITFLDIYRAVECTTNEELFHFHENPNQNCPVGRNIHHVLDDKLARVQNAMERELDSITLADVKKDTEVWVAKANPIVKGQYQEAANPIFEVFYLENPHGVIADFSGNPPYEF